MKPTRVAASFLTAALLVMGMPSWSQAQEVNFNALSDAHPNLMQVNTGLEHGFVVGLGYARVFDLGDRPLVLGGEFTLPYAHIDLYDYRLEVSVLVPLWAGAHWKVAGKAAPLLRGLRNDLAQLTNIGVDLGLVGGYYGAHWFVAAELGLDWAITTHIAHSSEYRDTVYREAKSGWYAPGAVNIYYGLHGGYAFDRFDIVLRVGQERTARLQLQAIPAYATLGVNWRF